MDAQRGKDSGKRDESNTPNASSSSSTSESSNDQSSQSVGGGDGSSKESSSTVGPTVDSSKSSEQKPLGYMQARDMKPSELVAELDRFIIGQSDAKKAVAIALRNRWRRHRLEPELRDEVMPKNILMIGPTGCGKTEIARRLARLTSSPFIKVEATKFTEVGFHGKDVESIIHDLVRVAIAQTKQRRKEVVRQQVQKAVQDTLLNVLMGGGGGAESFRQQLEQGLLEDVEVDVRVPVKDSSADSMSDSADGRLRAVNLEALLSREFGGGSGASNGRPMETRKMSIAQARPLLEEMEMESLLNPDEIVPEALRSVKQDGIVFLDELDKIATASGTASKHTADASSEGVQRDLLPLIEGTTVTTKHGDVQTDHILFIASGAFHAVKPNDLLAELQGRLPIRVELQALSEEDLYRIIANTENSLLQQQTELLAVDNIKLTWTEEAMREIAKVSAEVNRSVENIGARRLNTVIERIVDDISYSAPDEEPGKEYVIDAQFVRNKVGDLLKVADLAKFIL